MHRRKLWAVLSWLTLILAVGVLVAGWGGHEWIMRWSLTPFGEGQSVRLEVARGAATKDLARQLHLVGVIDQPLFFIAYAYALGKQRSLQAGDYRFDLPIAPGEVLADLQHGTFEHDLTIPEGWTGAQIEKRLLGEGWIERAGQWTELVARPVELKGLGLEVAAGAEGFCFPDTYRLERNVGAEAILDKMLREFENKWARARPGQRDVRSRELSTRDVVTLASVVEREARQTDEMPKIASVFLNRLGIKMKLQSCATVYYALGGAWDRPLTRKDLQVDSPYNTYARAGLPAGPICNPGFEAIEAVMRPAQTDDLYFVYRGDGTHEFTRTYQNHMKAARRHRRADPTAELADRAR